MVKTINGDLILTEDTIFKESIIVEGDIKGNFNLKVCGDIDCFNVDCKNIVCKNIDCENIDCFNVDCKNIDCFNVYCKNIVCFNIVCFNIVCCNIIFCENIKVKSKVIAKFLIKDRFSVSVKGWKL